MKKLIVVIIAAFVYASCTKEEVELQQKPSPALSTASTNSNTAARGLRKEFPTLIRKWTEWVYGRNANISPVNDKNGKLQNLAQPYSCGIFMLAGSSSQDRVNRKVTIRLSHYQYVFVPLVSINAFYDNCSGDFKPGEHESAEHFFQEQLKPFLKGSHDLILTWDGPSLLPKNKEDLRYNSGVFEFHVDPSFNGCPQGTTATTSTNYTDGYWAKVKLTRGHHTLTIGGKLGPFSNTVIYTIHII
jgi:hypothetical protein